MKIILLVLLLLSVLNLPLLYFQLFKCANLIDQHKLKISRPSLFFNKAAKDFYDFVLKRKYVSVVDGCLRVDFEKVRLLIIFQLLLMYGMIGLAFFM